MSRDLTLSEILTPLTLQAKLGIGLAVTEAVTVTLSPSHTVSDGGNSITDRGSKMGGGGGGGLDIGSRGGKVIT